MGYICTCARAHTFSISQKRLHALDSNLEGGKRFITYAFKLKFVQNNPGELDALLQRVSGFSLFLYSAFCVISAAPSPLPLVPNLLVLITASLVILQVLFQRLYIADVSKRAVSMLEHDISKPGRQVVTLLLLCNIAP